MLRKRAAEGHAAEGAVAGLECQRKPQAEGLILLIRIGGKGAGGSKWDSGKG